MALPLIAAGIAARAVAKKLATRAAGGITGAGAKQVNTVYRNMGTNSVKVIPAKPTSKSNIFNVQNINTYNTSKVKDYKSGAAAQRAAKYVKSLDGLPKKSTVKINSNPTRSR
jgi:hypothetical protein